MESARGAAIMAKVWLGILLSLLAVACVSIPLARARGDKPVIPGDLAKPETIRAAVARGAFRPFRGKFARIGKHYRLYPLAIYEYRVGEERDNIKVGPNPGAKDRLLAVYVPVISTDHSLAGKIRSQAAIGKGIYPVHRRFVEKLKRSDFHFLLKQTRYDTKSDVPNMVRIGDGFVADPDHLRGDRLASSLNESLANTQVEDLIVLKKASGTSYVFTVILFFMTYMVLFVWLYYLNNARKLRRSERAVNESTARALVELKRSGSIPRGPREGARDEAYDVLFAPPPRSPQAIKDLVRHNIKESKLAFKLAPASLLIVPIWLMIKAEAVNLEAFLVGLAFAGVTALGFLYVGFAQRYFRRRALSILRYGITYAGIVAASDSTGTKSKEQVDITEVYYLEQNESGQDLPRTALVFNYGRARRIEPPEPGSILPVLVDPRKQTRVAVYCGQGIVMQGRSIKRRL